MYRKAPRRGEKMSICFHVNKVLISVGSDESVREFEFELLRLCTGVNPMIEQW